MPEIVSLQACAGYDLAVVEAALGALLAPLGGLERFVGCGQRVILKPNLIAPQPPESAAVTHPAVLEALARRILALGATPVIADAPAWGGPHSVAERTGVGELCRTLGIEFLFLDRHTALPSRYPQVARHFHVDPRVLEADVVINVPKLKAHQQLGFTAALKNPYGCLAGREKAWHHFSRSRHDREFARYIVAYTASLPLSLHVVDGIVAMEGAGPRLGTPRPLNILAASPGAAELDAVLADLVALPPTHRLLIEAAAELGFGETDPRRIPLAGTPPEELAVRDFVHPALVGVFFSPWRLLRGWLRNRALLRREAATS